MALVSTLQPYMVRNFRPYVRAAEAERGLKPGDSFKECAQNCPEMVVIPAGAFLMGSPETEERRYPDEGPQIEIVIANAFAVAKNDVTFDEWDACVATGGCRNRPGTLECRAATVRSSE